MLLAKIQTGTLRLRPEPLALRRVLERAIEQLSPHPHENFLIEGRDPEVMADVPYLRHALGLLLQHVSDGATAQTIIRLAATPCAQLWLDGYVDDKLADPLTQVDQLLGSSDPGRGRQAAKLLRLVLSRALIELHGGAWEVANQSGADIALCLTLPLAHQDGDDE